LAMLTWCNVLFGENGIDAKEKRRRDLHEWQTWMKRRKKKILIIWRQLHDTNSKGGLCLVKKYRVLVIFC
jgi:hypothetical protein